MKKFTKSPLFNLAILVDDNDTDNIINEKIILSSHFSERVIKFSAAEDALKFLKSNGSGTGKLPEFIFQSRHFFFPFRRKTRLNGRQRRLRHGPRL